MGQLCFQCVEM